MITPLLIGALVIWSMYRRVRRSFGRQVLQPRRLWFRVGLLMLVGGLIASSFGREPRLLGSLAGGIAIGVVLGIVGLRHTKFEIGAQEHYYTPHTYIGLLVTSLFIVRIVVRYVSVYSHPAAIATLYSAHSSTDAYQRSPLTLAFLGLVVGYYVFYNLGILSRSRNSTAASLS
jgi:hypothetical protein